MAESVAKKPPTLVELIWEHDLVLGGQELDLPKHPGIAREVRRQADYEYASPPHGPTSRSRLDALVCARIGIQCGRGGTMLLHLAAFEP